MFSIEESTGKKPYKELGQWEKLGPVNWKAVTYLILARMGTRFKAQLFHLLAAKTIFESHSSVSVTDKVGNKYLLQGS